MSQHLKKITDLITKSGSLSSKEKASLLKELKQAEVSGNKTASQLSTQKRELEIEAALEKVRSRTMTMHESSELAEVVSVMYNEMEALGLAKWGCAILLCHEKIKQFEFWLAQESGSKLSRNYFVNAMGHKVYKKLWAFWKKQGGTKTLHHQDETKREFDEYWLYKTDFKHLPEKVKKSVLDKTNVYLHYASMRYGLLNATSYDKLSNEHLGLLARFAKVFEQTYTRFLDLKKAEAQAREAQIETALERIRTRALAMRTSDDLLEVSKILREQMGKLGQAELESAVVQLYPDSADTLEAWYVYRAPDNPNSKMVADKASAPYNSSWNTRETIKKYKSSAQEYTIVPNKKQLLEWYRVLEQIAPETVEYDKKGRMIVPDVLYYHFSKFSGGALLMITNEPPSDEAIELQRRAAKVFDLAYRRYKDLQKAEAQAREAQIETALERVRARTMAMHKSEELANAAVTLYEELKKLGITNFLNCGFVEVDEKNNTQHGWNTMPDGGSADGFILPLKGDAVLNKRYKAWKNKEALFYQSVGGEALKKHMGFVNPTLGSKEWVSMVNKNFTDPTLFYCWNFKHGYLHIVSSKTFDRDEEDIISRFARVFEQTYTRFLDLKKAEAQAREAQIETALERVRSRTMAMQDSSELAETAALMFDQLKQLGAELWTCGFAVCNKESEVVKKWMSSPLSGQLFEPFLIPWTADQGEKAMYDAWKKKVQLHTYIKEGAILEKTYKSLMQLPSFRENFEKVLESGLSFPTWEKTHVVYYRYGYLHIVATKPFEETDIFIRFAKVFEQTYTRFLDLKKAEAQAREAQIEAALERVRAKSMAMHKSEELAELSLELVKQVQALGVATWFCAFNIYDDDPKGSLEWGSNGKGTFPKYRTPREGIFLRYYEAGERGETLLINEIGEDECPAHYEYLCTLPGVGEQLLKMKESGISFPASQIDHVAFFKYGYILFITYEPTPQSHDIFKRFAKVFEQTYTRFLDLEKAEAQAREAKVEAALEKLRARSMAMQKSNELADAARTLYQELYKLGITNFVTCGFVEVDENSRFQQVWVTLLDGDLAEGFNLPLKGDPILNKRFRAWKKQEKIFYQSVGGEELRKHIAFVNPTFRSKQIETMVRENFPDPTLFYCWNFSQGYLHIITDKKFEEQEAQIISRFAGVFEQTYTRFLDLKKAEAQAREAQIEAAMERIRSRAIAMRSSDELLEVVLEIRIQTDTLGQQDLEASVLHLYSKDTPFFESMSAIRTAGDEGKITTHRLQFPVDATPEIEQMMENYWAGLSQYTIELNQKQMKRWGKVLEKYAPEIFRQRNQFDEEELVADRKEYWNFADFSGGSLLTVTYAPPSADTKELFRRSADVFDLAYKRYKDLQKAEAQAREANIEASLERVRSRTMAMQQSHELSEVAILLFKEVKNFGLDSWGCGFNIWEKDEKACTSYFSTGDGLIEGAEIPLTEDPIFKLFYESKQNGEDFWVREIKGQEQIAHHKYISKMPGLGEKLQSQQPPAFQIDHGVNFNHGNLIFITYEPCPEVHDIFKRFGKVFEQTYTRFLDLQKAEAQARQAQIEAAMERIRSRAIAMRSSDELLEVALEIRIQTDLLGQQDLELSVVHLYEKDAPNFVSLAAMRTPGTEGEITTHKMKFPVDATPKIEQMMKNYWAGLSQYTIELDFKARDEWQQVLQTVVPELFDQRLQFDEEAIATEKKEYWNFADFSGGSLLTVTYSPPTKETKELFRRASDVFDLAYKRYNDLKKAEAQAREAQVEASLERVRSRTMAMHKSEELLDAADILSKELIRLAIPHFMSGFVLINEESKKQEVWMGVPDDGNKLNFYLPLKGDAILRKRYESWKKRDTIFYQMVKGKQLARHLDYVVEYFGNEEAMGLTNNFPDPIIFYCANFKEGYLHILSEEILSEEQESTLVRFTKAFQQTYTRFLDLKRAEAQTREAQIEGALEKIRSRTMAMQHSNELPEAANLLFLEVQALGIPAWSCGYNILSEDRKSSTCWMSSEGTIQRSFPLVFKGEDTFIAWADFLDRGETFLIQELEGQAIESHYNYMKSLPELKAVFNDLDDAGLNLPTYQINHLSVFSHGFLLFITYEKVPEAHEIFKRFTKVFEQTYTRFLDLQKAEAQAKDAIKQASLDRVRGEIASMRNTTDLESITPLIFNELTTIGVPFIRCGVFIMDQSTKIVKAYLSSPEGRSLGVLNLPFDANTLTSESVVHWQNKKVYKEHWSKKDFVSWSKSLMDQGYIKDTKTYQGTSEPPESLDLHFIPFEQGMLYVGSENPLTLFQIDLVEALAKAFSVAYARYEDFVHLEKAKASTEKTLTELKATQNQLVQSEKMASLGELTAGIAHEIKNPLNFVNNFSEVTRELVEELMEEIAKGDTKEVKEIADDIIQNLDKIVHHGKRADGIVKGMLQHSRQSDGLKEPTDINTLADEYVRLAYHGLRAKDKSFNATILTDFDPTIKTIDVIPQEIGRVILNLLTNAFYVVAEKSSSGETSEDMEYEPTVAISTKRKKNSVEITVTDNGNGIPDNVREKIFQPFFTTKPTGQGTGLGLSMSYDIVTKGHGGQLEVESEKGKGTTFIVSLPIE